jgi:hypothetical protein
MSSPSSVRAVPRWLPSPVTLFVVTLGVLLFSVFLAKGPWDSDFYWHIRTGELIAHGQLPRTDPFSFTWLGMPWTLHEWLGELILYWLVDGLGYMRAVLIYALVTPVAMAILAFAFHRYGLRTTAVAIGVSMSALVVIAYATIRPQAVSWIMFAILVGGLLHVRPDRKRWVVALLPLFIVWANLHGLWAVGLLVLAVYAGMTLVGLTPMSHGAKTWALAMVPLAALGALFTPAGPSLLLYPFRYVDSGDWGMANITEWQSPDFHDPAHIPFFVFIAGIAFFGRWRVPWWMSILAFMGIAMTLLSLRNAPIAAIIGAPALAVGLDNALADWRGSPRVLSARLGTQRRIIELGLAGVLAVAGVVIFIPPDPAARVDASIERELPVQGVEILRERIPDGRILAEYGWGGYVIGQMSDLGALVGVDGRNDMYDDSILEKYGHIQDADPGWEAIVEDWEVDALLFPPYRAITKGPAEDAGWCEVFRDENEVLFLRTCD